MHLLAGVGHVQGALVGGEAQPVGVVHVGDYGRDSPIGRDAVDAAEVDLSLRGVDAPAGVGEVDAAVRFAHHVVGPVQALALPPLGEGRDGAVRFHAGEPAVVALAHDQPALQVEGQPVGSTAVLAYDVGLVAKNQPEDQTTADVHEKQVAARVP